MAKKKNQSNDKGKQSGGGGKNKDNGGGVAAVLKINLHCEGCASRVVKAVRSLDGVESVRIGDAELKKITVIGKIDPVKLRQKVEEKTKKKVELISPATKKDNDGENNQSGGGGGHKKEQTQPCQEETAAVKDGNKPKELPVTTAVLKVSLHCQGCIDRIHKFVGRTQGLVEVSVDKSKDLITVKGRIDMKVLAEALKDKLKRNVEIVTPKEGGGGEKKGKGGGGGGGGGAGGGKKEGHKMEHYGGEGEYPYAPYEYGPGYMVNYVHAPQLFSDENPNACTVM